MTTDAVAPVAAIDDPGRWEDSARRARRRRRAEARAAWLRGLQQRGVAVGVGAFLLAGGGAVAHQTGKATTAKRPAATIALLKAGSRGPAVAALQAKLGIPADGVYGPQTRRAVRRYQRRSGLAVDGIAGPVTLGRLGLGTAPAATGRTVLAGSSLLERIARCESGGDPTAVSGDGRYRGKYQFSRATWRRMGGKGDPAKAPEAEQDRRAAALLAAEGTRPWPACSRRV